MTTKLDLIKEYKSYYTAKNTPEIQEFGRRVISWKRLDNGNIVDKYVLYNGN